LLNGYARLLQTKLIPCANCVRNHGSAIIQWASTGIWVPSWASRPFWSGSLYRKAIMKPPVHTPPRRWNL